MKGSLEYNEEYPDSLNFRFWCNGHEQYAAFLSCPACENFPCKQLTERDVHALHSSPFFDREISGLYKPRRKLLSYIAKMLDGTFKELPNLDPNDPDLEMIAGVAEVYPLKQVLVPTVVLKVKPKQERDKIASESAPRAEKKEPIAKVVTEPKKKRQKKVAEEVLPVKVKKERKKRVAKKK